MSILATLALGRSFPNPKVETTVGNFHLYDYQGDSWLLFFAHPQDFTPTCTTEVAAVIDMMDEMNKRNCKPIGLSCDPVSEHHPWIVDVRHICQTKPNKMPFPIIGDEYRQLAHEFGMVDASSLDKHSLPLTCRAVFIVDPLKKLRFATLYPDSLGRNFKFVQLFNNFCFINLFSTVKSFEYLMSCKALMQNVESNTVTGTVKRKLAIHPESPRRTEVHNFIIIIIKIISFTTTIMLRQVKSIDFVRLRSYPSLY